MRPEDVVLGDLPIEEVRAANITLPDSWVADLDDDFVRAHAEQIDAFFRRVIPLLPPGEAFEMAAQCQGHYILGLAHLDAVATAADLLTGSVCPILSRVAEELDNSFPLAYGPDAGVSQPTQDRFVVAAVLLREVDLTIEPPDPVVY